MRRRQLLPLALLAAALATALYTAAQAPAAPAAYAPAAACAACHPSHAQTYQHSGMARSFSTPTVANTLANWTKPYYHAPSQSYFTMLQRGGKFFQRRHQLGPDGRPTNEIEKQVDFVLGSGHHARAYLHRTPRNTLIQLPLGWYADQGGHWAMNPGYDRPDHEGFRRPVAYDCMFCHNGYPRIPPGHEEPFAEPVYLDPLPQGIDCQRCHGPGLRHVELARAGAASAALREAIVNPARLTPDRREEVCMQCHLETTSFPLPNSLARYDRGPFDYQPGQPLSNQWLFFDHAPAAQRQDKFELVNAVYRIRQSRCFLESAQAASARHQRARNSPNLPGPRALGCTSCHDPHHIPRGQPAVAHYDAACRKCHAEEFNRTVAAGRHPASANCASCHMPKRRTEDVVHAIVTDHRIQRHPPTGDLLAPRRELHETGRRAYRGEVVLYYPPDLPASPTRELYTALAQVIDGSNRAAGIPRLAQAIKTFPFARPEFSFQLGEALVQSGDAAGALAHYQEAIRRNPRLVVAHEGLGVALRRAGRPAEAVAALRRTTEIAPLRASAWHELGLALHATGDAAAASQAIEKAITLDPNQPNPHSNLGIVRLASGDQRRAEAAFREAIRLQPDHADAHGNLANLLAGAGRFPAARPHFEAALRLAPGNAALHYNYAVALGRASLFDPAEQQLRAALAADPNLADAHELLANLLLASQQPAAALPHCQAWLRLRPGAPGAQLGLGAALARSGRAAEAIPHLRRAAAAPATRDAALALLRQLGANL
ncbi:MAG: tetratricopeptide repeat protein [Acidobacteriaceae bacterium]|nr:tetratricopeptide repeat protein [Acidobacteriaceae bacterium]